MTIVKKIKDKKVNFEFNKEFIKVIKFTFNLDGTINTK